MLFLSSIHFVHRQTTVSHASARFYMLCLFFCFCFCLFFWLVNIEDYYYLSNS